MRARVLVGALLLLVTAGCTQTAALAPVGGNQLAKVRFAANDILLDRQVQILDAPVCTQTDGSVSCVGSTLTGETITVTSTVRDKADMTVTVGADILYDGSVQDVLNAHARPSS